LVGALVALKRRAKEGSCTLLDAAGKLIAKAQVRRLHEPIAIGCGEQSIAPNPNGLRRGRGMEPNRSAFALLWFGFGLVSGVGVLGVLTPGHFRPPVGSG
jgi:hypothetical protein